MDQIVEAPKKGKGLTGLILLLLIVTAFIGGMSLAMGWIALMPNLWGL